MRIARKFRVAMAVGIGVACAVLVATSVVAPPAWAQAGAAEAEALEQRGLELINAGRPGEAEPYFKRALGIYERTLGPDDLATGKCASELGMVYYSMGRFQLAEPPLKRGLAILEKVLGRGHAATGPFLHGLGLVYGKTGRFAEAEATLKRALALNEKGLGRSNPEVIQTLNDLAELYSLQGKTAEAEAFTKRAQAAAPRTPGTGKAREAEDLTKRGLDLNQAGRFAEAEPLHRRALALREKALGPEHAGTGDSCSNLAFALYNLGRYAEAEPLFKRAWAIYGKVAGREHQYTDPLRGLALTYAKLGRMAEAEATYQRVLAMRERVLGVVSPDVVLNLEDLVEFYRLQGRFTDAELLSKRARYIREAAPAFNPQARTDMIPRAMEADELTKRGNEQFQAGRNAEAEKLYRRALKINEEAFGPEHVGTGTTLLTLALAIFTQDRYGEAETLMKRALAIYTSFLGPEHQLTGMALYGLALIERRQGRYAEAELHFKQGLAYREKVLGRDHPDVAQNLKDLAELYRFQGRTAEAAQLTQQALAIDKTAAGPADQASEGTELNRRGTELFQAGRYPEAEQLFKQALAVAEQALGPDHPDTAAVLRNLGLVYSVHSRFADAEAAFKRALAIREKSSQPDQAGDVLQSLAHMYSIQGRYAEAEPLYGRALVLQERVHGTDHENVAATLSGLGALNRLQARYVEAEIQLKRSLAIREKVLGPSHASVAETLASLATVYAVQGRAAEAEPLFKRAVGLIESRYGPDHAVFASSLASLATFYQMQRRFADSEPLAKRAVAVAQKAIGADHPEAAMHLASLGGLYRDQGRYAEAEPLLKRALAAIEKGLGPNHIMTATSLASLADVFWKTGRHAEAEPRFKRAMAILEKALGPEHPDTAEALWHLSKLRSEVKDWRGAYDLIARATAIHTRRLQRGGDAALQVTELQGTEAGQEAKAFAAHIGVASNLVGWAPERLAALTHETFTLAQWAQRSETAVALARMSSRFAKGDGALARLVRQRQDLAGQYQLLDKSMIAAAGKPPAERDASREADWRKKMAAAETQIAQIDAQLKQAFPEYAALAGPEPLTVEETQAQLRADEAIYQVIVSEEGASAWVVTREAVRWRSLPVDEKWLTEQVEALRCGLDESLWEEERGAQQAPAPAPSRKERCRALIGTLIGAEAGAGRAVGSAPFDLVRAHDLYRSLLAPFEDMIGSRHLIVVPHGTLAALPFQVLVTQAPDVSLPGPERYAKASWLIARQPVSVLPSVASLKALRRAAGRSAAPNAFAGFGNPLLTGPSGTDRRAWTRQTCARGLQVAASGVALPLRGARRDFYQGTLADVEMIRRQTPLPETADELCAVAADLGSTAVYLGSRATEQQLKELNARRALRGFRVLHFATHGLIAGETKQVLGGPAEPALLLTPPQAPSDVDDGLLTASEAAQLDLDADLVILSACNTAAGSGEAGAQALSGLARGFLYAGSRALLVSHWYVNSEAAVRLVTGTFGALKRDAGIGRAEALRRAMLAQIKDGGARAHPSYWAPFVIVGEGG